MAAVNLSIIASMGLGKIIAAAKLANPKGFEGFKKVIGIAGIALTDLANILEDDTISADEIDGILEEVQDTGAGRLVIGLITGAISKMR